MFTGLDEIRDVVRLLESRNASLWHACQLRDLHAYAEVAGIPSRSLLEQARLDFTAFVTDTSDRSHGLWQKVFLNLSDFGAAFARGWAAVPNPYGPIALQIAPRALLRASDVAICLRSAGASDFDREQESLDTLEELERVFWFDAKMASTFQRMEVRFGDALREAFSPRFPNATSVELSASLDPELIPFEHLVAVWVEPVVVDGWSLIGYVGSALTSAGLDRPVRERRLSGDRTQVLQDVVASLLDDAPPRLALLRGRRDVADVTREWAGAVAEHGLDWQYGRYANYLRDGTLALMAQDRIGTRRLRVG